MRVTASAPGKLVLLGEYAVLEGASALVLAVNRRARVTLTRIDEVAWEIVSPTLELDARLQLCDDRTTWSGTAPAELEWVATLLARLPQAGRLQSCRIRRKRCRIAPRSGGADESDKAAMCLLRLVRRGGRALSRGGA